MAGSSNTCAPYSSLTAWLITILCTAAWYSGGCCASSATVLTSRVVVVLIAVLLSCSQNGLGVECFQIGGEIDELLAHLHADGGIQRLQGQLGELRA